MRKVNDSVQSWMRRVRNEESGVETMAMLIVLPVIVVLILALVDVGYMMRTRMVVENAARDAARGAAADGGNYWSRTNHTGIAWDTRLYRQLYAGHCTTSQCSGAPSVSCTRITNASGGVYSSNVAQHSGDIITCTVYYPYRGFNQGLLNSPFGLGMGKLIRPFTVTASARAETGVQG